MCAACVVVHRQSSSAAPWVEVGLCRGSFLALCEWRWLLELICSTGSCVSALVPSSFSQLRCGSQQEAEAGGGEQAAMVSLLALLAPQSCFSSTQGPLVATGPLASCSCASWFFQARTVSLEGQQRGESLRALPQVLWAPAVPSTCRALALPSLWFPFCRDLLVLRLPPEIQGLLLPG